MLFSIISSSSSRIRSRADLLSRARAEGYGRALSLYDAVNRSQHAAGRVRPLATVSAGLPLLKRLDDLTPPGDTLQAVDLSLKVAAELLAFTQVNGLPGDSFGLPPSGGQGLLRLSYGLLEAPELQEALRRLFQALAALDDAAG